MCFVWEDLSGLEVPSRCVAAERPSALVSGRVRVVSRRDGVGVSDPAILAMNPDLSPALVAHDLPGSVHCLLLGIRVLDRLAAARLLDIPASLRVRHYVTSFVCLGPVS